DRLAERKKALRRRQQAVELHRRGRGVAGGELGSGREPDTWVHRREAIADFHIDHWTRERGVTGATVVAVVATLDAERQRDAERGKHLGGKRAERHHRLGGVERPFGGFDAPVC